VNFGSDSDVSDVPTASKHCPRPRGTKCQNRSQYQLYINNVEFNFITIIGDEAPIALHTDVLNEIKPLYNVNHIIPISFPCEIQGKLNLLRGVTQIIASYHQNDYKYILVTFL
jgi:hypothetical protein